MAFLDTLKQIVQPQTGINPFSLLSKIKKPAKPVNPTQTQAINQSFPTNTGNGNFSSIAGITAPKSPFTAPATFMPQVKPQIVNKQVSAPTPTPTPAPVVAPVSTPIPAINTTATNQETVTAEPTKIEAIPFKTGLAPEQQAGIKGLANKPVTSWSPTDLANWNYATNNAPLPETVTPTEPTVLETGEVATPVIPTIQPETQKAIDDATKVYQENLKISPEELSTQAEIDRLIEATKKGFQATSEQAIPLDFITGQLRAIENRAINLSEPLEAKLSRLQAARTSALDASKFGLERAEKKASAETEASRYQQERKDVKFTQDLALKNYQQKQIESDRTFEENTRQFGLDFAQKQKQIEQAKQEADRSYSLSVAKFNEDKRQFGENKAIENRKLALEEAKLSPTTNTEALTNMELVNDLLDNPSLSKISGIQGISVLIPGSKAQLAKNQYDQLKGILKLENRQKLKGQGQISDFEGKILADASSALGRNLRDKDFEYQLRQIRGVFVNASGLAADVQVYDPKTGNRDNGQLTREEIDSALAQGFRIEYK